MARVSKYMENLENQTKNEASKWRAAIYLRLSREDGDKVESDSINNQKELLLEFVNHETDISIFNIYVDDGWSGTNFERPAFGEMLEDVKSRNVNCVIVKDLSRFGRNYIEVGNYIEKVFPFMDIRFISVNDYLDSFKNPQSMNNLVVPFKNIINDEYCRDISNKVRSSLDMKRKQGKHIGSFALYGYLKDEEDNNKLIIDKEAAEVVKMIYDLFLNGTSILGIAKKLNEMKIPNPSEHKKQLGLRYRNPHQSQNEFLWVDSTVRRILKNRMYTGCMIQGINKVKSYKLQIAVPQPKENWYIVEDTHEPIIDKENFDKVQALFCRDTRTAPQKRNIYIFSGFLKCADCNRAMNRKTNVHSYGTYVYYACSTFKRMNKSACSKHSIREDRLEAAVLKTIQQQIDLAVSMDKVIQLINENKYVNKESQRLEKALMSREIEKNKIENIKMSLYPDWKNGDLSKDEYHSLKEQYDLQLADIENKITIIHQELKKAKAGIDNTNSFLNSFTKYRGIKELTRDIIVELIENIYIHEGNAITIQFKYEDEYLNVAEYIENNKNLVKVNV